jgi:hypothetical protein
LGDISDVIEIAAGTDTTLQSSIDINAFLTMRFREIAEEWPKLKQWPKPQDIQRLVDKAGGLFIWARVVADFIKDGNPLEQLIRIQNGEGIAGDMAALYSHILQVSFPNPSRAVMDNFHSILGAIIFNQRPLSAKSLASLLKIGEMSMELICKKLSSVVESGDVLQITHQSFTDFLIDKETCPPSFCISREHEEQRLTLACLCTMKDGLRFNICELESSYLLNSEVLDMESRIDQYIPMHLRYACWFWAHHLMASGCQDEILVLIKDFTKSQFLFWLEVLSVTKCMYMASTMVYSLMNWMKVGPP